MGNGG